MDVFKKIKETPFSDDAQWGDPAQERMREPNYQVDVEPARLSKTQPHRSTLVRVIYRCAFVFVASVACAPPWITRRKSETMPVNRTCGARHCRKGSMQRRLYVLRDDAISF